MRRSAVWMIAPALLAATAVTAVHSSAHLVTAEPARAVTTITATHSGSAQVVLYDDATLSTRATNNPDVRITGAGRLVAFELTREDGGGDNLNGARLPRFAGSGTVVSGSTTPPESCSYWPSSQAAVRTTCSNHPKAITLHEGYYHLVVVTDGAPVRITLAMHGLQRGTSAIHLQKSLRSLEATLPVRESIGASTITYGTDVSFAKSTQSFSIVAAKLHPNASIAGESVCVRSDTAAPPPYAYSPACPGGSSSGMFYEMGGPAPRTGSVVFVGVPGSSTSPNGLGGSFMDSDGPTYLGGLGVWLAGDQIAVFGGFGPDSAH
jgi:hypothetical protein